MNAKTIAQTSGLVLAGYMTLSFVAYFRLLKRSGLTIKEFHAIVDEKGFTAGVGYASMLAELKELYLK